MRNLWTHAVRTLHLAVPTNRGSLSEPYPVGRGLWPLVPLTPASCPTFVGRKLHGKNDIDNVGGAYATF